MCYGAVFQPLLLDAQAHTVHAVKAQAPQGHTCRLCLNTPSTRIRPGHVIGRRHPGLGGELPTWPGRLEFVSLGNARFRKREKRRFLSTGLIGY